MGEHRLLAWMVAARKCTPPSTRDQPHWSLQQGTQDNQICKNALQRLLVKVHGMLSLF